MSIQKQVPEFKVILIGDSGVGKTSLITRATQDVFDAECTTNTIGFSFQKMFKEVPGHGQLNLFVWDTAGQEMYRSMIKMYYRGIAVALIVYDVSDKDTFKVIDEWLKDVREKQQQRNFKEDAEDVVIYYVIGNKCDLDEDDQREVSYEEGFQWVEEVKEEADDYIDITFMEVSAKTGINIDKLFDDISLKLAKRHFKQIAAGKQNQILANDNANMSSGGLGMNRIEIIDRPEEPPKKDSCCKSC